MSMWKGTLDNITYEFILASKAVSFMHFWLIWIVLEIGGRWPYNCCFVGCCYQDLFNIVHSILVQVPSSFFLIRFVSVYLVHPYSRIDTTATWKILCLILSEQFDFHMIDNQSISVHAIAWCILMSLSVDDMLLPRHVILATNFRDPP